MNYRTLRELVGAWFDGAKRGEAGRFRIDAETIWHRKDQEWRVLAWRSGDALFLGGYDDGAGQAASIVQNLWRRTSWVYKNCYLIHAPVLTTYRASGGDRTATMRAMIQWFARSLRRDGIQAATPATVEFLDAAFGRGEWEDALQYAWKKEFFAAWKGYKSNFHLGRMLSEATRNDPLLTWDDALNAIRCQNKALALLNSWERSLNHIHASKTMLLKDRTNTWRMTLSGRDVEAPPLIRNKPVILSRKEQAGGVLQVCLRSAIRRKQWMRRMFRVVAVEATGMKFPTPQEVMTTPARTYRRKLAVGLTDEEIQAVKAACVLQMRMEQVKQEEK